MSTEEPLPRQKVAITVFAEVEAVDALDAEHIVDRMLSQLGVWPGETFTAELPRGMAPREVTIMKVMGAGTAMRNGYLGVTIANQAWRDRGVEPPT